MDRTAFPAVLCIDNNGEIVGLFSMADWNQGLALLEAPATRVQQFLAGVSASRGQGLQPRPVENDQRHD